MYYIGHKHQFPVYLETKYLVVGRVEMQREEALTSNDVKRVVEAIFITGNPKIYEDYSAFDSEIVSFTNASELTSYIARPRPKNESYLGFVVHYPDTQGFVEKRKIILNKEKCGGHSYRYSMSGWGLIQFQLNLQKAPDITCRFAVNTEKRANTWFTTYPELKSPGLWDWKAVEKHVRRLIRELKKYAKQGAPMDAPKAARH